jgi:predicted transcriptional regulator
MTELEQPALANLASDINQEHTEVYRGTFHALEHAMRCGMKLLEAKELVPENSWERWCLHNLDMTKTNINRFMRIAAYRDQLMAGDDPPVSVYAAYNRLKGLAPIGDRRVIDVEEATKLRKEGLSYEEVGERLGVTGSAVWQQLNPEQVQKINQRKTVENQRRRRAKVEERIEQVGGGLADAYALLQDSADALEQVIKVTRDAGKRSKLTTALAHLRRGERAIAEAINTERKGR